MTGNRGWSPRHSSSGATNWHCHQRNHPRDTPARVSKCQKRCLRAIVNMTQCYYFVISSKKNPSLYHSIKSYNVQWPMSQVATCYRRGVTCDSSWVTCDSSWVTCDCSWVTCDSFSVTCGHLWHRSLNMLRFYTVIYWRGARMFFSNTFREVPVRLFWHILLSEKHF